jgi:hypothetical protein
MDLSRLRRRCDEPPPRPMRRLHLRRPDTFARDQGTAWRGHHSSQAGAGGVGRGQPGHGLRPGAVPPRDPAQTSDRETLRDRRHSRVLEGVSVGHQTREMGTARFDVGGTFFPRGLCNTRSTSTVTRVFAISTRQCWKTGLNLVWCQPVLPRHPHFCHTDLIRFRDVLPASTAERRGRPEQGSWP